MSCGIQFVIFIVYSKLNTILNSYNLAPGRTVYSKTFSVIYLNYKTRHHNIKSKLIGDILASMERLNGHDLK